MLLGLLWAGVLLAGHFFGQHTAQEFVRVWGSNVYVAVGPRRRDVGSTWAMGYAFIMFFLTYKAFTNAQGFSWWMLLGLVCYGGWVAWHVGEAIALKLLVRDIIEKTAKEQVRQGIYNPPSPPESVRPALRQAQEAEYDDARWYQSGWDGKWGATEEGARVVGGEVTFNSSDSVPARAVAQQHEGLFAFDPARFKHRDPPPQASPALPRGDQWQSPPRMLESLPRHDQRQSRPMSDAEWDDVQRQRDYKYQEWQNEERERTSRQAAARQPAPPAQAMPSFTYNGSRVWK